MFQPGKIPYLYHFTTFESATKILATRCLRFSDIDKLNDINESSGPTIICNDVRDYEEANHIFSSYSQISLTMDKGRLGFDIPAMWGHYARCGHGVCLVLNKEQCLLEISKQHLYSKEVDYHSIERLNDIEYKRCMGPLPEFIEKTKDDLYFHKTSDWEYEQEYRIITNNGIGSFFSIRSSLIAVILFSRTHESFLNSAEFKALSMIGNDIEFYRYSCPLGQYELYDVGGNSIRSPIVYDLTMGITSKD